MTTTTAHTLPQRLTARATFGDECAFCRSTVDFRVSTGAGRGSYLRLPDAPDSLVVACVPCAARATGTASCQEPIAAAEPPAVPAFRPETLRWLRRHAHQVPTDLRARIGLPADPTPTCGAARPVHARLELHADDFEAVLSALRFRASTLRSDAAGGYDQAHWDQTTRELMARGRAASIEQAQDLEALATELRQGAAVAGCCAVRVIS